jgi:hypothetical protein
MSPSVATPFAGIRTSASNGFCRVPWQARFPVAVFALLDVRVTILEHIDRVRVRVEGSVAHDLLLSSVSGGLAPSKLAPHGT